MTYLIQPVAQVYGDQNYQAFKLSGATSEDDRYYFGDRISQFGVIDFGAMSSGQKKRAVLSEHGINSPIQLVSIYAFAENALSDEARFRLFDGEQLLVQMRLTTAVMPFAFLPGAIVRPHLTLEVEPRYPVDNLTVYWQPIHILQYTSIN